MKRQVGGAAVALPFARAAASGASFALRAAAAERRRTPMYPGMPNPQATAGLAASVAIDEMFMMPVGAVLSLTSDVHFERSSAELDEAVKFYEERGWLNDPSGYFTPASAPDDVEVSQLNGRRGPVELLRYSSGWRPHDGEPGGQRWQSVEANREVWAAALRHPEPGRPWLICLHGQGQGRLNDVQRFRARELHHDLGVNVLLPVLPMHSRRRTGAGLNPEHMFTSTVYPQNNVLGLSQAMWDLRRIMVWLRETQQAPAIGVFGFSLGSYVASLLSTLEADLACVIAVVPSGDLAGALRASEPLAPRKREAHLRVHDWRSTVVHRLVSPLSRPCLVAKERRFIVAGQGDRVALPSGATLLWKHWDEPSIMWRPRGHLTIARAPEYHQHLEGILRTSGLAVEGRTL